MDKPTSPLLLSLPWPPDIPALTRQLHRYCRDTTPGRGDGRRRRGSTACSPPPCGRSPGGAGRSSPANAGAAPERAGWTPSS
jgi:hypothetical protein